MLANCMTCFIEELTPRHIEITWTQSPLKKITLNCDVNIRFL